MLSVGTPLRRTRGSCGNRQSKRLSRGSDGEFFGGLAVAGEVVTRDASAVGVGDVHAGHSQRAPTKLPVALRGLAGRQRVRTGPCLERVRTNARIGLLDFRRRQSDVGNIRPRCAAGTVLHLCINDALAGNGVPSKSSGQTARCVLGEPMPLVPAGSTGRQIATVAVPAHPDVPTLLDARTRACTLRLVFATLKR